MRLNPFFEGGIHDRFARGTNRNRFFQIFTSTLCYPSNFCSKSLKMIFLSCKFLLRHKQGKVTRLHAQFFDLGIEKRFHALPNFERPRTKNVTSTHIIVINQFSFCKYFSVPLYLFEFVNRRNREKARRKRRAKRTPGKSPSFFFPIQSLVFFFVPLIIFFFWRVFLYVFFVMFYTSFLLLEIPFFNWNPLWWWGPIFPMVRFQWPGNGTLARCKLDISVKYIIK